MLIDNAPRMQIWAKSHAAAAGAEAKERMKIPVLPQ